MSSLNEQEKKCCGKCLEYGIDGGNLCERWLICDENCTCHTPTHKKKEEEKIREEWNEAIYEIGIDTFPNGEPSYSEIAPKIADWWLKKIEQIKSTAYEQGVRDERERIVKEIKNRKLHLGYANDILDVINNNKEI